MKIDPKSIVCQGCHSYYMEPIDNLFPPDLKINIDGPQYYVDCWCPFCGSLCRFWLFDQLESTDWIISKSAYDKKCHSMTHRCSAREVTE